MVIIISLLLSVFHKKKRDNYVIIVCLCICVPSFVTVEPSDFYENKLELKELAQDRDRCRALVGTVRNLRVPKMRGIS